MYLSRWLNGPSIRLLVQTASASSLSLKTRPSIETLPLKHHTRARRPKIVVRAGTARRRDGGRICSASRRALAVPAHRPSTVAHASNPRCGLWSGIGLRERMCTCITGRMQGRTAIEKRECRGCYDSIRVHSNTSTRTFWCTRTHGPRGYTRLLCRQEHLAATQRLRDDGCRETNRYPVSARSVGSTAAHS